MKRLALTVLMLLTLGAVNVFAQNSPCDPVPAPPDTIFTGRPPTATWTEPVSVVVNGVTTPNRVDGFEVGIWNAAATATVVAPIDIGLPVSTNCSANLLGYMFTFPNGLQKASYQLGARSYNFVLDANGNPTTTKQYSARTFRPFVVVDPVLTGPPPAPTDVRVR